MSTGEGAVQGLQKYCGRWLILLVCIGILLVFGIFRLLYETPGQADSVVKEHPTQILQ